DVPIRDDKGHELTPKEQLKGWWNSILNMDRIPQEQAGQKDPLAMGVSYLRKTFPSLPPKP
ncbi:MAG: hypothetical protein CO093_09405, partial [Alphaproteobacteria bacterium CG_4_9_14_3_um_filter_47_13]